MKTMLNLFRVLALSSLGLAGCAASTEPGDEEDTVSESSEAYTGYDVCHSSYNGRTLAMSASFVSRTNPWLISIHFAGYPYTTHNDAYITLRQPDGSWFKVHTPDNMVYNETRRFDIRYLPVVACSSSPCSTAINGPNASNNYSPGNVYTVRGYFDLPGVADPGCTNILVM